MNPSQLFRCYLEQCPLVAIIRGVRPDEVEGIGRAIIEGGIRIIEVPLNSPDPFDSIRRLSAMLGDSALVGAGTVLTPMEVEQVKEAGGRLIVSPNANTDVIRATVSNGLVASPGFFTPSEAFQAIAAGAHALKLFPAEGASPAFVKAQRAVLPRDIPLLVVGGVTAESMQPWLAAGADGFGLGSALYKAGQSAEETGARARAFVAGLAR